MVYTSSLCTLLIAFLLLPRVVLGHTYLSWISLDGTPQDEGDCVRPHPPTVKENPIPLVTDADMTCGWLPYAAQPANRACPIEAGGKIGLQWHHTSNTPEDDIIAVTHVGPCLVYLAKSDSGAGPVWFKIYEDGYDESTQKWCVDKLLANKGLLTVTLPSDIAPGNYLLRGEIFALHGANALNGVQPYVGCAELTVSGSGTATPAGVSIPGVYTQTDPGLYFDIYQPYTSYPIPGSSLYVSSSPAPGGPTTKPTTAPSATSAPTTKATSAPTTKATSAPSQPTTASKPVAESTSVPTVTPTNPPSTNTPTDPSRPTDGATSSVRVQLYPSSSEWWLAATARSDPETTVIELRDSGTVISWHTLQPTSWGYWTFPAFSPLVLPISLRLTSATGQQIELTNIFSSWSNTAFLDTGRFFSSSPSPTTLPPYSPTTLPPYSPTLTPAATSAHTQNTTEPHVEPEASAIKLITHEGSSPWWFAVAFSQTSQDITEVDMKDSDSLTEWSPLTHTSWGYWVFATQGTPLATPITFRLTSEKGQTVEFVLDSLSPNSELDTSSQFV